MIKATLKKNVKIPNQLGSGGTYEKGARVEVLSEKDGVCHVRFPKSFFDPERTSYVLTADLNFG